MIFLDSGDNFFVTVWEAIVKFFTVILPDFFMNAEDNWIWFIIIGVGLLAIIALIIILAVVSKKRRKRALERVETRIEEEKAEEDEAAQLERIRHERELAVRNASDITMDELIARRAAEEKSKAFAQSDEEERKLQEAFAAQPAEVTAEDDKIADFETSETVEEETAVEEKPEEEPDAVYDEQIADETSAALPPEPEQQQPDEEVAEAPVIEEKPEEKKDEAKKPAAKKPAAAAKKETKPADTVMYSIVYDRVAREWVVRKTGSPRAIRRLRTKAEALEYAEQLSVRQGLALQVHKKDGKFQKKN